MRALAHKLGAVFAGKMPHAATLLPGGVTEKVTALKIAECRSLLERLQGFIDRAYLPDVVAVAKAFPEYFTLGRGCGNFLSFGVFPETADGNSRLCAPGVLVDGAPQTVDPGAITEDVGQSWFSSASGLKAADGQTLAAPDKAQAYTWVKAPRYKGLVMEVGALARTLVAYQAGHNATLKTAVDGLLKALGRDAKDLVSVMGRHAARAIECKLVADRCAEWLEQLVPDAPTFKDYTVPETGAGFGLTEAARGALGHWISISGHKISNYQCVVPTTWNCSPRDDRGLPGAMEQALVGTPIADADNPIEAARVVRSFDPCLACAVH